MNHPFMKIAGLSFLLWLSVLSPLAALTGEEIQHSINEAIKAGGGEIMIPTGTHVLERGLMLKDAKNIRITGEGEGKSILKLAPVTYAYPSTAVGAGAVSIPIKVQRGMKPGMQLHIEAPGVIEPFTGKPRPFHTAMVKAVEKYTITLAAPLEFPIPDGTLIRDNRAPNMIEIRGASENIRIENLTLDGGRTTDDPPIRGHVHLCGISAFGAYSYEAGPNGPQIKNLTVSDCTIQNCHGRGISLYAAENAAIHHCTIRDVTDEAINFDHFTVRSYATHNRIKGSPVGIELNDATDCLIASNEISESGIGLKLWRWCKHDGLNEGNLITGNVITKTKGDGMVIASDTSRNIIARNVITHSGKNGLVVAGKDQIIQANKISASQGKAVMIHEGNIAVGQSL